MKQPPQIQENSDGVTLSVWVKPRASKERWSVGDGRVELSVTAAPEGGKANEAACRVLADALGVPRSRVTVRRGHTSRQKQLAVQGLTARELAQRLGLG